LLSGHGMAAVLSALQAGSRDASLSTANELGDLRERYLDRVRSVGALHPTFPVRSARVHQWRAIWQ
jgi:hypothetical protein